MQILTPLLLIGFALGGFFGYITPQWQRIEGLRKQKVVYVDALVKAKQADEIKKRLQTEYNSFTDQNLKDLQKLLPDTVDNIRLLLDLNQIVLAYGANISGVKVDSGAPQTQGAQQTQTSQQTTASTYSSIGISFTVKMTYENFLKFIRDIQRNLRLTDVTSIKFNSVDKGGVYDFGISLRTYWLK